MCFALRCCVVCAGLCWAASLDAAVIKNRSDGEEKFTVIEANQTREVLLRPSEHVNICSRGCVVRLSNGDEYELYGDEIVAIEEGLIFLDGPEFDD